MLQGIDVSQRIEFSSVSDTGEPKTVFVLKPLSGLEMLEFSGGGTDDIKKMIIKSIVEVKNFSKDGISIEEVVGSLNLSVVGELINKINYLNNLSRQDEKN